MKETPSYGDAMQFNKWVCLQCNLDTPVKRQEKGAILCLLRYIVALYCVAVVHFIS